MNNNSPASLFDVKGKIALVTGGATGIGYMIAKAYVQSGVKVYIASRNLANLTKCSTELTFLGPGSCHALAADVTSKAGIQALVASLSSRESKLNILINNSGVAWGDSIDQYDEPNGWDRLFALNVKSIFYLSTLLVPLLEKGACYNTDPARIINISSVAGTIVEAEMPLAKDGYGTWSYNASKAAVNHLTRSLALTLAKKYITVNAIAPGVFPSKMTKFGIDNAIDVLVQGQPMGRIGCANDMSGMAVFLAGKASSHVTGAIIPLDGGQSLNSGAGINKL